MRLQDLAFLACRLAAFYFLYLALVNGIYLTAPSSGDVSVIVILTVGLHIVLAAGFWLGAEHIVQIIGGPFSPDTDAPSPDYEALQAAVFAGVGLFLLAAGLSRFLGHMIAAPAFSISSGAVPLIQIAVGTGILFGAVKLSGLIAGLRGGQAKRPAKARPSIREAVTEETASEPSAPRPDSAPVPDTVPAPVPASTLMNGTTTANNEQEDDDFGEIWSPEGAAKTQPEPEPEPAPPPPKPRTLSARAAEPPRGMRLPSPDPAYRKFGQD